MNAAARPVFEPLLGFRDTAFIDCDQPVISLGDQGVVVCCEQHCRPGRVDLFEESQNIDCEMRVEVAGGLVGEDERRLRHDRPGDRDTLFLTARQITGLLRTASRQADPLERLRYTRSDESLRHREDFERHSDVLEDRLAGQQAEILEAVALETSDIVGRPLKDISFPKGAILAGIIRNDDIIIPSGESVVQPEDRIIIFAKSKAIPKIEKILTVKLEFF